MNGKERDSAAAAAGFCFAALAAAALAALAWSAAGGLARRADPAADLRRNIEAGIYPEHNDDGAEEQ